MQYKDVSKLEVDRKFEKLTPVSKEEFTALEKMIVADGEIHSPIIVWQGQKTIVDGHSRLKVLQKYPKLKYTVKELPFEDWQEVMVWIVEHHIARRSFSLWQKLEMAIQCEDYWEAKARATENQGTRNDLKSPSDQKSVKIDIYKIVADKVGCGRTTVTMFKKVLREASEGNKQRCREGDMSIKRAYKSLPTVKTKDPDPQTPPEVVVEMEGCGLFEDSQNGVDTGKKNLLRVNGTPMDSSDLVARIQEDKVPDGAIWVVLNKELGQMSVVKKSHDKDKGIIYIKVNSYNCKVVSAEDGVVIFEADHINGGTRELLRKDDSQFESKPKLAS